ARMVAAMADLVRWVVISALLKEKIRFVGAPCGHVRETDWSNKPLLAHAIAAAIAGGKPTQGVTRALAPICLVR
ncbi:hypothetical protein, partial [Bradyrhizobium cosmicum]|uniref:hypothetical protein n=1 Tax=Bradyrhizobium cosmicum TaxID=1404864 RepID=UPI0028E38176